MTTEVLHTCLDPKKTCASCRGCAGRRADHVIQLTSGESITLNRCGHCDGPQAHAVQLVGLAPPVRHCGGHVRGFGEHEPHVIGKASG